MTNKTKNDSFRYLLDIKNDLIDRNNNNTESIYNRANDIDVKIGSDLLILASASIAVIGGTITSISSTCYDIVVFGLIISMITMVISIICGIIYYYNVQHFWEHLGDLSYKEGELINNDKSESIEDFEILLKKIKENNSIKPIRMDSFAKKIQLCAFVVGVAVFCITATSILFCK